jgi:hypothetical protein
MRYLKIAGLLLLFMLTAAVLPSKTASNEDDEIKTDVIYSDKQLQLIRILDGVCRIYIIEPHGGGAGLPSPAQIDVAGCGPDRLHQ